MRKASTILFFFFLTSAFPLRAQKAIELNDPAFEIDRLQHYITYYGDSLNNNVDHIAKDSHCVWVTPDDKPNLNFGISQKIFWLKFIVRNSSHTTSNHYVLLHNRAINRATLYQEFDGKIQQVGITGDHQPFYQRTIASNHLLLPIYQPARTTATYYLKLDKRGENLNFKISLIHQQALQQKDNDSQLYLGIFTGIILLTAFLNLILFLIFKDKITLWYSIYNITTIGVLWIYEGLDLQYFKLNTSLYPDISRYIAGSVITLLFIHIMQIFTGQNKENSRFYQWGSFLKWMIFLMIPLTVVIYSQESLFGYKKLHFEMSVWLQIIGMFYILISCIEKIRQHYKPAYFYLAAVMLLLVSSVLGTLSEVGYFKHFTFYTPNLFQWSFVIEVILISVGIIYRYYLAEIEKQRLTQDITELKVNSIRNILDARQKEQIRIASDLHDQLGGELAVIKLSLLNMQDANTEIPRIIERVDLTAASARSIAHNLIPPALQEGTVAEIIASQIEQLNATQDIQFTFHQSGHVFELTKDQEILLYRVLMEFIQNILKHSAATEANIQLFYSEEEIEISVEDNGIGIPVGPSKGIGIKGIQTKVKLAGGVFQMESSKGSTLIIIRLPHIRTVSN